MREINKEGLTLVKKWEGVLDGDPTTVNLDPYIDPVGVWTIGWGHALVDLDGQFVRGPEAKELAHRMYPEGISYTQAEYLLQADLINASSDVTRLCTVELNENQFSALVSFQFNTGALRDSTLRRLLNAGDYLGAANQFGRWTKGRVNGQLVVLPGLVSRRADERKLFQEKQMTIPDYRYVPKKLYDTGFYNLKTHEGQGAFVDACVSTLHGLDENFGHLRKKPGQTQVHGHGEDATLYKFEDGTAQAVDFIGGAGGPNPQPGWGTDGHVYKHNDWLAPTEHGVGNGNAGHVCPPVPTLNSYPDEPTYWKKFTERVKAAYVSVGRKFPDPNDPDAFRRFSRCGFDDRTEDINAMADKHIAELRRELGAPRE